MQGEMGPKESQRCTIEVWCVQWANWVGMWLDKMRAPTVISIVVWLTDCRALIAAPKQQFTRFMLSPSARAMEGLISSHCDCCEYLCIFIYGVDYGTDHCCYCCDNFIVSVDFIHCLRYALLCYMRMWVCVVLWLFGYLCVGGAVGGNAAIYYEISVPYSIRGDVGSIPDWQPPSCIIQLLHK